jgi:hypothetical protein
LVTEAQDTSICTASFLIAAATSFSKVINIPRVVLSVVCGVLSYKPCLAPMHSTMGARKPWQAKSFGVTYGRGAIKLPETSRQRQRSKTNHFRPRTDRSLELAESRQLLL